MNSPYGAAQGMATLPFEVHRLQAQPVQYQPGQVPHLPQIPVPPQLMQYYPLLVWAIIDNIQASCQASPLRTFLFNQMATSNFSSPEFVETVGQAVRLLEFKVAQGLPDLQGGIRMVAAFVVELRAAYNTHVHPGLQQYLDQQTMQAVRIVLQNGQQMLQQVAQFQQAQQQQQQWGQQPMMPMGGMQQPMQQPYPGVMMQPGGFQQPTPANLAPSWQRHTPPATTAVPQQPMQQDWRQPAAPPARPPVPMSDWRQPVQEPVAPAPVQSFDLRTSAPGVLQVQTQKREWHCDDPAFRWVPSARWPVMPAYDPNIQELYFVEHDEGIEPQVRPKPKDRQSKTLVSPWFVKVPALGVDQLDVNARLMSLERAIIRDQQALEEKMNAAAQASDADGRAVVSDFEEDQICEGHIDELWQMNEVELMALETQVPGAVATHRSICRIKDVLITKVDPQPLIDCISVLDKFHEVAMALTRTVQMNRDEPTKAMADLRGVNFINRRLTESVNQFLTKELALSGTIDSFAEDAPQLIAYLGGKFDVAFANQLRDSQKQIVERALRYDVMEAKVTDVAEGVSTVPDYSVLSFYSMASLTSVSLYASELGMSLPKDSKSAVAVVRDKTPVLWRLASNILAHAKSLAKSDPKIAPTINFIRTADGLTLEVSECAVNPEFILVSLSK